MSEHEPLEPLDAEIAAMLTREGSRLDTPSADVEARLWGNLAGAIGGGGGDGGGSGGDGGAGAGAGAAGGVLSKAAPYLATLIGGAAIGAFVHARVQAPTVIYVDRPAASAVAPTHASASAAPSSSIATVSIDALPTVVAPPAASVPAAKTSASAEVDESFVVERRLLDAARTALASGDTATSLAKIEEHVKTFPKGRFQEEREALRVRTLSDAGRKDEARAAATRFETRWPGSVLLPAVKGAVE